MYKYECISRAKVDKQTALFPSHSHFLLWTINLFFAVFVLFGSFLALIWFEIFLFVAHLYKYLSSAVKTSRTNNTPFFDFSECSKTIDEKRVIQESIHYESYYCGEFIPPHNTTLELKLERVSSLGKNERKCYHHRIR